MARTEVVVNDDWKIVKIDSLNWQVHQRREIKKGNGIGKSREGEVDWVALPAYFARVERAAEYVYDHMRADMGKCSLADLVKQAKADRAAIVKAVGR